MKAVSVLFMCIVLSIIMASCSVNQKLDNLNNVNVSIVTDESIIGKINVDGKEDGKYVTPTSLYYSFTLQKPILMSSKQFHQLFNEFDFFVEPSTNLKELLEENVGRNIFDLEKNKAGTNADYMAQRTVTLNDDEIEFSIAYSLGAKEQNPLIPLLPNEEILEMIHQNALQSTLVFKSEDGEEVLHNLRDFE
ncbi:hypothetical protein SAMN05877753_11138 [Bacillus oleivorans]|uniref:Uncharacterized protein n=1 Tax=Bacillus oleivorans TaxID=1448271 RepID=A0A285D7B9_9BACI|nr:hypothetical protein [Bacillus oleivorans]SNX75158.1 hypothetical protein SAMN05877753_11138 [Bacillus oleivorans]